jgi:hypothetical protein
VGDFAAAASLRQASLAGGNLAVNVNTGAAGNVAYINSDLRTARPSSR